MEISSAPRGGAAGVALEARAVARHGEVAAFGAGFARAITTDAGFATYGYRPINTEIPVSLLESVQADITQILLQKCGGRSAAPCRCAAGVALEAGAVGHGEGAAFGAGFADFTTFVMTGLVPVIHALPLLISTDA
jgi:hypothetical protein